MIILDEFNNKIDTEIFEKEEQIFAERFVKPGDTVLELGARYGSVSYVTNRKLSHRSRQVVVEPDQSVWEALEYNKRANECDFHIVKGFVSNKNLKLKCNGYATTSEESTDPSTVPHVSLEKIQTNFKLKFNEGFLETFFDDQLRLVIFEADFPEKCNYQKITDSLRRRRFICLISGFQNVWLHPGRDSIF